MAEETESQKVKSAHSGSRRCWIYKSARREEIYLYLADENKFDAVPKALIEKMGRLEMVMELELYPGKKLARANVAEVMKSLQHKGYYLQLPPLDVPRRHRLQ
jgi:uncharacterized protein YcgL (UPF0745 family)